MVKIPLYLELIRSLYRALSNRAKVLYPVAHHNFNFFWLCLHRWERHSWKCWQRHESIRHGTIRFFLSVALRIRSSFKGFLHCGTKVLGVVQSTKCFVLKWETACRFFTCVVRNFFYLDTDFIDNLFRVPMLPFSQTYLFRSKRYPRVLIKWNCFIKTGLNTIFIVSVVITASSVTKMISHEYKLHVL